MTQKTCENLKRFERFIEEVGSTTKINEKLEIASKYKDDEYVVKMLVYSLSPQITFGVNKVPPVPSKYIEDNSYTNGDEKFIELLDNLNNRVYTGKLAQEEIKKFKSNFPFLDKTITKILKKDLRCNFALKMAVRAIPDICDLFSPMKGNTVDGNYNVPRKGIAKVKLDGVRNIAIVNIEENRVEHYSFNGIRVEQFDNVFNDILIDFAKQYFGYNIVFDGEMVADDWNECRQIHTFPGPSYTHRLE